jgi:hypothetical protein
MSKEFDEVRPESSTDVSSGELAAFLQKLSTIYESRQYGNPRLARALRELASAVRTTDPRKNNSRSKGRISKEMSAETLAEVRDLDKMSVEAYLADSSKTKEDLLLLAVGRFSIPVSQLRRMKTADIRRAIQSALLHESSIDIISEQAGIDGSQRSS